MDIDGASLLAEARRTVESYLTYGKVPKQSPEFRNRYSAKSGVFVTITQDDSLRGCIGYPDPHQSLCEALSNAAIAAATRDPRFEPLTREDISRVSFEVTVLEPPRMVEGATPEDIIRNITPGRDGLIVRGRGYSGLLLPQVADEYGWSAEEFLENVCRKAGLGPEAWRLPDIKIWKFGGTVFAESDT